MYALIAVCVLGVAAIRELWLRTHLVLHGRDDVVITPVDRLLARGWGEVG